MSSFNNTNHSGQTGSAASHASVATTDDWLTDPTFTREEKEEHVTDAVMTSAARLGELLKRTDVRIPETWFITRIVDLVYDMDDLARLVEETQYDKVLSAALDVAGCPKDLWNRWKADWGAPKARMEYRERTERGLQEFQVLVDNGILAPIVWPDV